MTATQNRLVMGSRDYRLTTSGVARAFPGGRVAHPEGQNEEENEKSLRKHKKN